MTTTTHAAARRLLSARLDAPLTSAEANALAAHLAGCASCRAFEQRLAAGMLGLTTLPRVPGNPAVTRSVQAGLQSQPRASWLRNGLKLAGALVAFGLVGVVLVTVLRPSNDVTPQLQPGAAVGSPTAQPTVTTSATRDHSVVPLTPTVPPKTPSASVPACDPRLLQFTSSVGAAAGTRGITIMAAIPRDWLGQISPQPTNTALGGEPCHLASTVTLTLVDASGAPLDIDGNGAETKIDGDLPGGPADTTFLWSNWCGATEGISGLATIGGEVHINVPVDELPPCNGPGQPSTLAVGAPNITPEATSTATVSNAGLPVCQPGQLTITPRPELTGADVTFTISASLFPVPTPATAATPCQLASAALSLTDQEGQPLTIDGNGAALKLDNELGQNDAEVTFVWSNWCGETGVHFADLTLGEQHSGFKFSETPACVDASQPSALRASAVPSSTPTPTVTLESCGPDSYTLELSAQGFTGTLGFSAGIVLTGAPCHLTTDATLAILDADGNALDVQGNPATLHVDANLTAAGLSVGGGWRNWCGEQGDYQFVVTLGQQGAGLPVTAYARCDQPDQPSTLTHVAVYDPNAPPVRPLVPTATP